MTTKLGDLKWQKFILHSSEGGKFKNQSVTRAHSFWRFWGEAVPGLLVSESRWQSVLGVPWFVDLSPQLCLCPHTAFPSICLRPKSSSSFSYKKHQSLDLGLTLNVEWSHLIFFLWLVSSIDSSILRYVLSIFFIE